jgi:hypothetical protein
MFRQNLPMHVCVVCMQEYARRFGLKVQMEYSRRRREGRSAADMHHTSDLEPASRGSGMRADDHPNGLAENSRSRQGHAQGPSRRDAAWPEISRGSLTIGGIVVAMLAIFVAAVLLPGATDRYPDSRYSRRAARSSGRGRYRWP